uniref:CCHC-type domain-containing protein n=1 Tax=Tanacetum cinerariifolium TaxID=118510 RepID=A0A6L2KUS0_TANCI|nr:hypothetical protein [Tanacetum cinerariifolium]
MYRSRESASSVWSSQIHQRRPHKSDPEEDLEEYEDDETEDGPVDYPIDRRDDGDDNDGDSSRDDADDEDEDDGDEEEEEHLALADSAIVIPTAAISLSPEAEVERLLSMPTPPPSPLTSLSPPSAGEHLARMASTQALIDVVTVALPSPPLPPPLYIPPPVDRRDDIPETEILPRKRLCLSTLGSKYEIGEISTARPTEGRRIDYGFVSTLDAEARRRGIGEVRYGIRDTWVDPAEAVFEIAPMEAGDLLMKNKTAHQETILILEEEAYAAREAWAHLNSQIRSLGPDAYSMTWEVLKKKMTDTYCPQGEIKKLEIELWNLKVKGNDVPAYTENFQELTLICTKFFVNEPEKINKYIDGLPDNINGSVKASKPKTLVETIKLANDLMDQKLRTYAERQTNNKRKADDSFRNNHGHFACDCRSSGNTTVANAQRDNRANPKGSGCFECGAPGHFKRYCPKLKNKDGGNVNAQGWVYAEKKGNTSREPDSNVVTRNSYDVELADGKIVGVDAIMRGCMM